MSRNVNVVGLWGKGSVHHSAFGGKNKKARDVRKLRKAFMRALLYLRAFTTWWDTCQRAMLTKRYVPHWWALKMQTCHTPLWKWAERGIDIFVTTAKGLSIYKFSDVGFSPKLVKKRDLAVCTILWLWKVKNVEKRIERENNSCKQLEPLLSSHYCSGT